MVNANVFASAGFFVGGSINIQSNSYNVDTYTLQDITHLENKIEKLNQEKVLLNDELQELTNQGLNASESFKDLIVKISLLEKNLEISENSLEAQKKYNSEKQEYIDELNSYVNKTPPSVSLLTGYAFNKNKFSFITELGLDINIAKLGDHHKKEIEIKNNYTLYLTEKIGYYVSENTLMYITGGIGLRENTVFFKGNYNNIDKKEYNPNLILGVGYEAAITKNFKLFSEFNHIISLEKIKLEWVEISTKSNQFKIGARYYF